MGADQQFCLRWNNFHSNITSAFESLRDDEDFVDITLACDGKQIKAHKMVLSACSPYFRSLLKGKPSILYTPVECPLCKRRFFNKYSAKRHMIQAHGENRFHTRPYARADPTSTSSFSAALQAMGVGYFNAQAQINDHSDKKALSSFPQDSSSSYPSSSSSSLIHSGSSQGLSGSRQNLHEQQQQLHQQQQQQLQGSGGGAVSAVNAAAVAVCTANTNTSVRSNSHDPGNGGAPQQPLLHNLLNNNNTMTVPSPSSSCSSSSSSSSSSSVNRSGHLGHESTSTGGPLAPPLALPQIVSVRSLRNGQSSFDTTAAVTASAAMSSASLASTFSSSQNL